MRGPIHDPLWRAWALLLALGAATTLSAAAAATAGGRLAAPVLGAVILGLAGAKARLILARYLGLAAAPAWLRAFSATIAAFLLLLYGIFLVPAL